ncbi:UDP-glucose dehydrogenase family protein [Candidatus Dependentiae bacterium]
MKKIAVVGAGYVGLVTGACFAQKEDLVIIIERDEKKIQRLLDGKVPFYEPGLDQLVSNAIVNKKIIFVRSVEESLKYSPEIIFSCVGTPSMADGSADLSAVWSVAKEVGKTLNNYFLFINKSTVPVGTAKKVENIIKSEFKNRNLDIDFDVASNPEFLKEGDALDDFLNPDRVVIGIKTKKAENILYQLYKPFLTSDENLLVMNPESAELTKYASNAMLATRISFMNQLSFLADKVGADISMVKSGMAKDRRIGPSFLNAGIGYGGSCFPKDVKALIHMGKENNLPMSLVDEVENINYKQRKLFIDNVFNFYGDNIENKKVGILGLSFKPETDDIRCAPAIDIIKKLLEKNLTINAYDPVAWENTKNIFGDKVNFNNTAKDVLLNSDFLIILTEWKEFLKIEERDFLSLKDKVIFDGRNCFDPIKMQLIGINYFCVGRNSLTIKSENNFFEKNKKELNLSF